MILLILIVIFALGGTTMSYCVTKDWPKLTERLNQKAAKEVAMLNTPAVDWSSDSAPEQLGLMQDPRDWVQIGLWRGELEWKRDRLGGIDSNEGRFLSWLEAFEIDRLVCPLSLTQRGLVPDPFADPVRPTPKYRAGGMALEYGLYSPAERSATGMITANEYRALVATAAMAISGQTIMPTPVDRTSLTIFDHALTSTLPLVAARPNPTASSRR
jgi:hypothetical protein